MPRIIRPVSETFGLAPIQSFNSSLALPPPPRRQSSPFPYVPTTTIPSIALETYSQVSMQIDSPSNLLVHNSFALGGEPALAPPSRPLLSQISTKVNDESSGHARESRRGYPSFGMAAEAIEIENNGHRLDEDPFKSASAPERSSAFPVGAVNAQPVLDGGLSSSPAHAFLSMFSSPSAAQKTLVEDTVVAGYTLVQTIGHGGFSTVKKGISPNGEVVAVKMVKKVDVERQDDPDECRRQLYNEMEIWRTLNHEHILPLFTVELTADADYFVTLFCPAGSLFDILKRDGRPALAQDDAGMLFRQVVRGLRYLHDTAKIVHGDIKLENILVDEAGTCRIADFGLSRRFPDASSPQSEEDCHCQHERGVDHAVDRLRRYTTISHRPRYGRSRRPSRHRNSTPLNNVSDTPPGLPCHHFQPGSLEYAAPELLAPPQLQCPIHTCFMLANPAQDMWALGVLLYALLAGHLPFSDSFEPRLQMKILHGAYESPLGIGHGAESVLRGCLERVVPDRWTIDMVDDVAWGVGWGSAGDVSTETTSHTPSELNHDVSEIKGSRSRSRARPYPDRSHESSFYNVYGSDGSVFSSSISRSRSRAARPCSTESFPPDCTLHPPFIESHLSGSTDGSSFSDDAPTGSPASCSSPPALLPSRGRVLMSESEPSRLYLTSRSQSQSHSRSRSTPESPATPSDPGSDASSLHSVLIGRGRAESITPSVPEKEEELPRGRRRAAIRRENGFVGG